MRFAELDILAEDDMGGIFSRVIGRMKKSNQQSVEPRPDSNQEPRAARAWDLMYGKSHDPETGQYIQGGDSTPDDSVDGATDASGGKPAAEAFLGASLSNRDWDLLVRATAAEAGQNQQERAAVMGVILNRVRSSRFPNSVRGVLYQPNQFQAVTGTRADGNRPSRWFTSTDDRTKAQVSAAAAAHLKDVNKTWLNFTSNVTAAYGAGTNIGFRDQMRRSDGATVIGGTVFGTV